MSRKLICITGMDGTGKSTVIKGVKAQYNSIYVANIWDLMHQPVKGLPFKSKQDIDDFLCALTPDSRLLFLSHAMKYSIDKAMTSESEIILIDSYFYKYFATEKALGANVAAIIDLMKLFPEPDLIIELELPVDQAARRKKHFSHYECGLNELCNSETFSGFQIKVKDEWKMYNRNHWQTIDASLPEKEVLEQVVNLINTSLSI